MGQKHVYSLSNMIVNNNYRINQYYLEGIQTPSIITNCYIATIQRVFLPKIFFKIIDSYGFTDFASGVFNFLMTMMYPIKKFHHQIQSVSYLTNSILHKFNDDAPISGLTILMMHVILQK